MACVCLVSYSILVNGHAQTFFKPSRGIRQEDPLSPYLFILCVESLSLLLFKAEQEGSISSMPIGNGFLRVNHLFYINDSLLFFKANSMEWSRMMHLLELYEYASG